MLRLIDDIVIFSKTKDERANLLQEVLEKLLKKEVRINFDKSKFFKKELKVLGYKVNSQGIFPNTKSLANEIFKKEIKTRKGTQKLIGVINWYRKFIPNLSTKIAEISNLLKGKENKALLTPKKEKVIYKVKEEILNGAKLCFPNYKKKFLLECDASDIGLGSILRQEDKIIGYYSKKIT